MPRFPLRFLRFLLLAAILACVSSTVIASGYAPEAGPILQKIYSFDLDGAISDARHLEQAQPENPLGFLLEAEAVGWKIWCTSAEYKYGFTDARHRPKLRQDQHYFELAAKVTSLAEAQLKMQDSAPLHFYAGMGQALAARLYGLRGENRNVARAGVRAREQFLLALQLDPNFADADFGLGLYNYYVDTLGTVAKILRFFMGIPGGSKQDGIRQLELAIAKGDLSRQDASFYLALNSIKYDQNYERALQLITPLTKAYPSNPLFLLLRGDALAKLASNDQAIASYRAAEAVPLPDPECAARVRTLADASLAALNSSSSPPASTPSPH
jgi:tetratricopeptide (TPR) repeat protein